MYILARPREHHGFVWVIGLPPPHPPTPKDDEFSSGEWGWGSDFFLQRSRQNLDNFFRQKMNPSDFEGSDSYHFSVCVCVCVEGGGMQIKEMECDSMTPYLILS